MSWPPSITVASVIFHEGRYLLVKEIDRKKRIPVLNQPAGHLEPGERETFEESNWKITIEALLGIALFRSDSGNNYLRHTFLATPIEQDKTAELDPDIISTHWFSFEDIGRQKENVRSPMVIEALNWHRSGATYPLDLLK